MYGLFIDKLRTCRREQGRSLIIGLGQFTRNYTQTTKRGLLTTNKG